MSQQATTPVEKAKVIRALLIDLSYELPNPASRDVLEQRTYPSSRREVTAVGDRMRAVATCLERHWECEEWGSIAEQAGVVERCARDLRSIVERESGAS